MLPSSMYKQHIKKSNWEANPAQLAVVHILDKYSSKINSTWYYRILPHKKFKQGVYLHGNVGCGKTSLLEIFYRSLKTTAKSRMHFHIFMEYIQDRMNQCKGIKEPIRYIVKHFSRENRVLFLDEFIIQDITNAMLIRKILSYAAEYNIFIITTSNDTPTSLYKNGINTELFQPAIDLITNSYEIIELDSDLDYRTENSCSNKNYYHPVTKKTNELLLQQFQNISGKHINTENNIIIKKRPIHTIKNSNNCIWLNFNDLVKTPRSHSDYQILSERFQTIIISNLRPIKKSEKNIIYNFCYFIDICYDRKVRVIISASCNIKNIFQTSASPIARTLSRLYEMQQI